MRASSPASTPTCTPHRCAADRRTCLWRTSSPSPGSGVPASILGDRQNAVPHPIGGRRRGQTPIAPLGTTGSPPVAVCRPTDPRPRWPILAYGEKSGLGVCPSNSMGRVRGAAGSAARRRDDRDVSHRGGAATTRTAPRRHEPLGTWGLRPHASLLLVNHATTI